jgi:hypothetical protein
LGQLLSSGIVVRRAGKDVELKPAFAKYLEATWLPFARNVADSFLQFGFVVVSVEEEEPRPFEAREQKRSPKLQKLSSQTPPAGTAGKIGEVSKKANLTPIVAETGTWELSFVMGGRAGYRREYRTSCLSASQSYEIDPSLGVFFRSHPDGNGNICSPVATCFENAAFVAALQELGLQAEVVRARSLIVTQPVAKQGVGTGALDAARYADLPPSHPHIVADLTHPLSRSLFFDSESRAIQSADQATAGVDQAESLSLMASMCKTINDLRTTQQPDRPQGRGHAVYIPPELPPNLFTGNLLRTHVCDIHRPAAIVPTWQFRKTSKSCPTSARPRRGRISSPCSGSQTTASAPPWACRRASCKPLFNSNYPPPDSSTASI